VKNIYCIYITVDPSRLLVLIKVENGGDGSSSLIPLLVTALADCLLADRGYVYHNILAFSARVAPRCRYQTRNVTVPAVLDVDSIQIHHTC